MPLAVSGRSSLNALSPLLSTDTQEPLGFIKKSHISLEQGGVLTSGQQQKWLMGLL